MGVRIGRSGSAVINMWDVRQRSADWRTPRPTVGLKETAGRVQRSLCKWSQQAGSSSKPLTEASPCKEKNKMSRWRASQRAAGCSSYGMILGRLIAPWYVSGHRPMKNRLAAHQTFWVRPGLNGSKNKQRTRHHLFPIYLVVWFSWLLTHLVNSATEKRSQL